MTSIAVARCACGRPTPEAAYLCRDCVDEYAAALVAVPDLALELDVTLSKQTSQWSTARGRSALAALPYDVGASRVLHELRAEVVSLVRLCVAQHVSSSDYRKHRWPADSLQSIVEWLRWRIDGVAAKPWAADTRRLVRLVEHAREVVDRPPDEDWLGPCDICGTHLSATPGQQTTRCRTCGTPIDLEVRRRWLLEAVLDALATAAEIARGLTSLQTPVTEQRIRQWRHRGRLVTLGHDAAGRPLYRVRDVVELLLEAQRRASP